MLLLQHPEQIKLPVRPHLLNALVFAGTKGIPQQKEDLVGVKWHTPDKFSTATKLQWHFQENTIHSEFGMNV